MPTSSLPVVPRPSRPERSCRFGSSLPCEFYRGLLETVSDAIVAVDEQRHVVFVNAEAERIFGYGRDEVVGEPLESLLLQSLDAVTVDASARPPRELVGRRKNGEIFPIEVSASTATLEGQAITSVVIRDTSDRRRAEQLLQQSKTMEAVGQLAGGVAHDFNNLLTVVRANAERLGRTAPPAGQKSAQAIVQAVDRAAALTAQLLAFGGKQPFQPAAVNLDEVLGTVEDILTRLLGANQTLRRVASPGLGHILTDRVESVQVLMSLVANASEAMPEGGVVTIETGNIVVDEALAARLGATAGEYVALSVRDEGVGMDEELRRHIFEPFFTTKPLGAGVGLGLSSVYGIVKRSGAYIDVVTAPGRGSTFTVFFPPCAPVVRATVPVPEGAPAGGETILVAEDEDDVRELIADFLTSLGYNVLTAQNGQVAMQTAAAQSGPIHLLLTDVVMPVVSGPELAEQISGTRPDTKLLFMSGFAPDFAGPTHTPGGGVPLVRKPFALDVLAHAVRDALGSAA